MVVVVSNRGIDMIPMQIEAPLEDSYVTFTGLMDAIRPGSIAVDYDAPTFVLPDVDAPLTPWGEVGRHRRVSDVWRKMVTTGLVMIWVSAIVLGGMWLSRTGLLPWVVNWVMS
jgi:hypothetical protein